MAKKLLLVDMDGTLARFHDEEKYLERMYEQDFFFKLKPFEQALRGIKKLIALHADEVDVNILSTSISDNCSKDKYRWCDEHLPEIPREKIILTPVGEDKMRFITITDQDASFLLDDYNANLENTKTTTVIPIKAVNNINDKGRVGKIWQGYRCNVCSEDFYEQLTSIIFARN